jgi:hypothetical protein
MKTAASIPVGDRESPLEADSSSDVIRTGKPVGEKAEVSPYAGGSLVGLAGKLVMITGLIKRLGQIAGFEVKHNNQVHFATLKDLYIGRQVLEDVQVGSSMSLIVREALSHWNCQRDYWGPDTSGVEAFFFELSSVTDRAHIEVHDHGWRVVVPGLLNEIVTIDCFVTVHENYWTMTTQVFPLRVPAPEFTQVKDHWGRTFLWTKEVVSKFKCDQWGKSLENLEKRMKASALKARNLCEQVLPVVMAARKKMAGEVPVLLRGGLTIGISKIRLPPRTLGLTEQPTDRRPYTVISISPDSCKSVEFLKNVITHECIHLVTAVRGGAPHNDEFQQLAETLKLPREHRG